LLIDEIDKSDIDLPNDLLNVFEEGEYYIPELARLKGDQPSVSVRMFGSTQTVTIKAGHVRCLEFPFVVLTSNGEREFPAPFLRRCLRLTMPEASEALLTRIVKAHLGEDIAKEAADMITDFAKRAKGTALATDQLLSAIFLVTRQGVTFDDPTEKGRVLAALQKELIAAAPTGPVS
jgi:MoxR-like ATPase